MAFFFLNVNILCLFQIWMYFHSLCEPQYLYMGSDLVQTVCARAKFQSV